MDDRKSWSAKTLFIKFNSSIKPEHKVSLTDSEENCLSSIRLVTVKYKHLFNLCADEDTIRAIAYVFDSLSKKDFDIKTNLLNLLYGNTGYLYELLAYYWLLKRGVRFAPQVSVASDAILSNKSSGSSLDGMFLSEKIYFDIKSFEIPANIKETVIDKLSSRFPDFNIMLEGKFDSDYSESARLTLEKINEIENAASKALSIDADSKYRKLNAWSYQIPELGVSIKFEKNEANAGVHIAIGEVGHYAWAMNNEVFFLKNVEQYTRKTPFMLICPYNKLPLYNNKDDVITCLRAIARRAFIRLYNISEVDADYVRYNNEAHRKVDSNITVAEITSYLSGILFIDIAKTPLLEHGCFFANPNAVHRLNYFHLEQIFNYDIQNMPYYDDFANDNY